MEQVKIQYVNDYRKKQGMGGFAFVVLSCLGFACAVSALCGFLWVFR